MELIGETSKMKIAQLLLLCLQYAIPKHKDYSIDELINKSKFQNSNDFKKMRSCIDLLEDSECAIINFYKYGLLSSNILHKDFGEIYLRLYGILNAIYLQKQAIIEIAELVRMPKKI